MQFLVIVPFVDSSSVRSRPIRGLLDSLLGIALSPLEEVGVPSSGDGFTFSPLSAESLPPEQRALAEQAMRVRAVGRDPPPDPRLGARAVRGALQWRPEW